MNRKEKEIEARKKYIIDAAAKIFGRDGYDNASVNEIAKEAEFTKRTLYKYFKDKADLYLSVLIETYGEMVDELLKQKYEEKNAIDILKKSIESQYHYYKNNPETFKIMYDIGNVRKITDNEKIEKFLEIDKKITKSIMEIVELGQRDGSISNKYDSATTTINLKFIISSIFDKLSIAGDNYINHINLSKEEFESSLIDMIINTVKTK
jgi:AcrR family transcriptional regulator